MKNHKKYYTKYWLPPIIYCLLIFVQSTIEFPVSKLQSFDKLLHFIVYFLLGILIFRAVSTISKRIHIIFAIVISVFASTLIGLTDEMFQLFTPSRTIDRLDVLSDFAGSASGIITFLLIRFGLNLKTTKTDNNK